MPYNKRTNFTEKMPAKSESNIESKEGGASFTRVRLNKGTKGRERKRSRPRSFGVCIRYISIHIYVGWASGCASFYIEVWKCIVYTR